MTNSNTYGTHAASISMMGVIFYCYNENLISIKEFVDVENSIFKKAMQRQWKLFGNYAFFYNENDEIFTGVCFN